MEAASQVCMRPALCHGRCKCCPSTALKYAELPVHGRIHVVCSGQLPASWALALPKLVVLHLEGSQLQTTLPPEWGAPGAFQKCATMLCHACWQGWVGDYNSRADTPCAAAALCRYETQGCCLTGARNLHSLLPGQPSGSALAVGVAWPKFWPHRLSACQLGLTRPASSAGCQRQQLQPLRQGFGMTTCVTS